LVEQERDRFVNSEASCHNHICGAGSGMFLLFRLSSVMILLEDKRCLWYSIFLDGMDLKDPF
jgi:hypothetical protein